MAASDVAAGAVSWMGVEGKAIGVVAAGSCAAAAAEVAAAALTWTLPTVVERLSTSEAAVWSASATVGELELTAAILV